MSTLSCSEVEGKKNMGGTRGAKPLVQWETLSSITPIHSVLSSTREDAKPREGFPTARDHTGGLGGRAHQIQLTRFPAGTRGTSLFLPASPKTLSPLFLHPHIHSSHMWGSCSEISSTEGGKMQAWKSEVIYTHPYAWGYFRNSS